MNKILIVDASDSDCRLMSGLLTRAGYEPVIAEDMEAAKQEVAKLSPGAVIVSAMKFRGGTARELINWLKEEGYKFPVLAVVDNLVPMELIDVMCDWGAVNIIQRPAIDKQLVEMVNKYASTENVMFFLDNTLIRRKSADFRGIEQYIEKKIFQSKGKRIALLRTFSITSLSNSSSIIITNNYCSVPESKSVISRQGTKADFHCLAPWIAI